MTTTTFGNNWAIPVRRKAAAPRKSVSRAFIDAIIESRASQVRRELARHGLPLPEVMAEAKKPLK